MNRPALITGASGGIGRALAWDLAKRGHDLILAARNRPRLEESATELQNSHGITVKVIPVDLSLSAAPEELYRETRGEGVEILVNNAGFGGSGPFATTSWENERQMMQLNVIALAHLTKRFVKDMVERGSGRILNVASTAAFQPGPFMSVYYATKAFVLSFSDGIGVELKGTGVTVTCLCPGPTETEFQARANTKGKWRPFGMMRPEEVAQAACRGMMEGKTLVVPGFSNKVALGLKRFVPRRLATRIVGGLNTP